MSPIITLEEHYASSSVVNQLAVNPFDQFPPHLMKKMYDLSSTRIQDLDTSSISLQVLSHGPLDANLEQCQTANNELAAAIKANPTRLAGFAMLPMCDPQAAAEELSRCVKDHKFLGALLDNHLDGEFYDSQKYHPVWKTAEELDVPIYLHPTFASDEMLQHYKGNYDDNIAMALSAFGWGWHTETGLHFLRLFASGLFDKFPKLKLVLGHMGEMIPFQLERCVGVSERWGKKERGLMKVWKENVWVTTSGMFTLAPLACLLAVSEKSHVLFSVDYPFSGNEKGREFLEVIRNSGLLTKEEMVGFEGENAERLLKIKAKEI